MAISVESSTASKAPARGVTVQQPSSNEGFLSRVSDFGMDGAENGSVQGYGELLAVSAADGAKDAGAAALCNSITTITVEALSQQLPALGAFHRTAFGNNLLTLAIPAMFGAISVFMPDLLPANVAEVMRSVVARATRANVSNFLAPFLMKLARPLSDAVESFKQMAARRASTPATVAETK